LKSNKLHTTTVSVAQPPFFKNKFINHKKVTSLEAILRGFVFLVLFSIHFLFRCSAQKILELTGGWRWKVEERGKKKDVAGFFVLFSIHFLFRCSAQKILELTDG